MIFMVSSFQVVFPDVGRTRYGIMEINQSTKSMVISDSPQGSVSFTFTYDPMVGFEDLNRWFSWLSWFSWKF